MPGPYKGRKPGGTDSMKGFDAVGLHVVVEALEIEVAMELERPHRCLCDRSGGQGGPRIRGAAQSTRLDHRHAEQVAVIAAAWRPERYTGPDSQRDSTVVESFVFEHAKEDLGCRGGVGSGREPGEHPVAGVLEDDPAVATDGRLHQFVVFVEHLEPP